MNDYLFLYWFTSYTIGTISLLTSAVVYILKREEVYRDHIFVLLSFTGIILSETLGCYFDLTEGNASIITILRYMTILSSATLIYTLVRFVNTLVRLDSRLLPERIAGITALTLILLILGISPFYRPMLIINVTLGFLGASILYSVGVVILHTRLKPEDRNLKAALIVALVTILVFPFFIVFDFYRLPLVPQGYSRRLWILPAFYIIWNLSYMTVAVRELFVSEEPSLTLEKGLAEKYGLTNREQQIATLLMEGKRYRDIADILDITMPTVKTHISNIYDKTETRTRTTLMHKLLDLS